MASVSLDHEKVNASNTAPWPESSEREKSGGKDVDMLKDSSTFGTVRDAVAIQDLLVLLKDGLPLHPQPTSDPLDPLNWTDFRKHSVLVIVMSLYFMFTYITTTTVPSFPALATLYNLNTAQTNWTVAVPALGLAIGPLVWSSPADILGRRIIVITGTLIALASTIGAATASTYNCYMAARFFQGFGVSPASTVGLAIINDTFFEYQRGQKVGLWVLAIDMGLLVGPLIAGFVNEVSQAWVQWVAAILFGTILVAEILFLPETLYPRNAMLSLMPYTTNVPIDGSQVVIDVEKSSCRYSIASDVSIKRTQTLDFLNFAPVPSLKHPKPWDATIRFVKMWKYAAIPLAVCIYGFGWYWWILSIMTYVPVAYVQYPPPIQGLLFIGLILGTLFSETFFSGALGDRIVRRLARANGAVKVAEMRLWLVYPAAVMSAVGLIVWGISIDKGYHWIVGQVAFFFFAAGIQTSNTCVSAYIVDAYPLCSTAVITFYAVILNLSAFLNPFFITPWVDSIGFTWTFATQGIITLIVGGGGLGLLHLLGGRIRAATGAPGFVNAEFDFMI